MFGHVNEFGGLGDARKGCSFYGPRRPHEGDYRAIVICIRALVEESHAFDGLDSGHDGLDNFRPATFGEIGNAFNYLLGHRGPR